MNEFESFKEAKIALDSFFTFYNNDYPHSVLDGMRPIDFEKSLDQTQFAA